MARILFEDFLCEMTVHSKLPRAIVSAIASVIYNYEDKYYLACEKYIKSGVEDVISFEDFSTERIKKGMKCTYIEALMILNNIENDPENAYMIYAPYTME